MHAAGVHAALRGCLVLQKVGYAVGSCAQRVLVTLRPALHTGLLTYNDSTMFDVVANKLSSEGLCSKAVAKEHLLPAADLQGAQICLLQ